VPALCPSPQNPTEPDRSQVVDSMARQNPAEAERWTQNPAPFTGHEGSTPSSSTIFPLVQAAKPPHTSPFERQVEGRFRCSGGSCGGGVSDVVSFLPPGDRQVEILTEQSLAAGAVFGAQGPGRRQDRLMRAMWKPSTAESRAAGLTTGVLGCTFDLSGSPKWKLRFNSFRSC
jgi:hypothetical protein